MKTRSYCTAQREIKHPVIGHNEKEYKNIYIYIHIYIYIYEPLFCIIEPNTILYISYTLIKNTDRKDLPLCRSWFILLSTLSGGGK